MKFCNFAGVAVFSVLIWIWHKELGLESFGPFKWKSPDTQSEEEYNERHSKTEEVFDLAAMSKEREAEEFQSQKDAILEMLEKGPISSIHRISNKLSLTQGRVRDLLYSLIKEGLVRRDGSRKISLLTLADSLENLALNKAIEQIKENNNEVKREQRFVKFDRNRNPLDGVVETTKDTFLLEVKFVNGSTSLECLDSWVKQLQKVAEREFRGDTRLVLILVFQSEKKAEVDRLLENLSYTGEGYSINIWAYSEEELKQRSATRLSD